MSMTKPSCCEPSRRKTWFWSRVQDSSSGSEPARRLRLCSRACMASSTTPSISDSSVRSQSDTASFKSPTPVGYDSGDQIRSYTRTPPRCRTSRALGGTSRLRPWRDPATTVGRSHRFELAAVSSPSTLLRSPTRGHLRVSRGLSLPRHQSRCSLWRLGPYPPAHHELREPRTCSEGCSR